MQEMCPYCNFTLLKLPKRNSKCPNCSKIIYVRKPDNIIKKILLTKPQADTSDDTEALISIYNSGVTKEYILEKQVTLTEKFGKSASLDDALWSIYHELALKHAKNNDKDQVSYIYANMAMFMYKRGKQYAHLAKERFRHWLLYLKDTGAVRVEIAGQSFSSCPPCMKLDGMRVTITEALENSPLPPQGCICKLDRGGLEGYCTCNYIAIYQD